METGKSESIHWERIQILLLDSDGVLTDGGVYLPEEGGVEMRRFNIKDGLGITRLLGEDFPVAVISRSPSTPVRNRCERLGIGHIFLGAKDKVACAEELLQTLEIPWENAAFMGDDLPDLPLLAKVGLAMAPRDAAAEVVDRVDWVSGFDGGQGAVREACDQIYRGRFGGGRG